MNTDIKEIKNIASNYSILFVEDNIQLQKQVMLFLNKLFKDVYIANNGKEGIKIFKDFKPEIVLTDLTMPEMSGTDMIKEIKKIDPKVNILILTAHSTEEVNEKLEAIVVDDIMQKPVDISKMLESLSKTLVKVDNIVK